MTAQLFEIVRLNATEAAPLLLGWSLELNGKSGRIVEVEAYTADDPASHSYLGRKPRSQSMFLEGGHLYVYRSYGVHWCLNLVTGKADDGQAVLIRALQPNQPDCNAKLYARPGKLCAGFGIDGSYDGKLIGAGVQVLPGRKPDSIVTTTRIGISKGVELKRRFVDADSKSLSRRLSRK